MILDARGHEANGNGASLTERQKAKLGAMNATINDVNDIAHAHAVAATNHLGNQIPGLVHSIIHAAIQGYHASLIEMGVIPPTAPIGKWVEGASDSGVVPPVVPENTAPDQASGDTIAPEESPDE